MYSPLCHISIFWCFICMHTTESFRINQPARSILKAPGQISTQRDTHGSSLNFTLECIWRKWNVFPAVRDQDFFLIVLKTFWLEEMTGKTDSNKHPKWTNLSSWIAYSLVSVFPGELPVWMRLGIILRASELSDPGERIK